MGESIKVLRIVTADGRSCRDVTEHLMSPRGSLVELPWELFISLAILRIIWPYICSGRYATFLRSGEWSGHAEYLWVSGCYFQALCVICAGINAAGTQAPFRPRQNYRWSQCLKKSIMRKEAKTYVKLILGSMCAVKPKSTTSRFLVNNSYFSLILNIIHDVGSVEGRGADGGRGHTSFICQALLAITQPGG